jgi:energy-coupling factor transporter ATP-binding protein EcfA2/TolA-binding protein
MFLKRLLLVRWGNIPDGEFEFGPVNLFSGANGSGKTTAADAIQTLMTAAHENLYHYNPGQEETTQRGRGGKRVRTLASYVLGCDDGSYARLEMTDGYIGAIFQPTQGESSEPFTALVCMRAWLDQSGKQPLAREDSLVFFILPTVELEYNTLVETKAGEKHVVELERIQDVLIRKYGKRAVERYDQKRSYLRRLYGAMRGKRDSVSEREALAAARAFSRFMAYKPVHGISQFVMDEVLERKDLTEAIRSISGQLKAIHAMEREAQTLKESAELLERAANHTQVYLERWTDLRTLDYIEARANYGDLQAKYLKERQEYDRLTRELEENAVELQLTKERHAHVRETLISMEAQRRGVPELQRKDALKAEEEQLSKHLGIVAQRLLEQDRRFQENVRATREIQKLANVAALAIDLPDVLGKDATRVLQHVRDTEAVGDVSIHGMLQRDFTGDLDKLEQELDDARAAQRAHIELHEYWHARSGEAESRRDAVAALHQRWHDRYKDLTKRCEQKHQEILRLERKQSLYPPHVERALAAIRKHCQQADARVLCDHVEVGDPRWQMAIEGYLGGARFSILVSPEHEADAIRIVRALSGRDNSASVIQGHKALREASLVRLPADSIVHVLKLTHAVAQAFLTVQYGSVVRVANVEALRNTGRGVTEDGIGSGGYRMFRCDLPESDLVFGAAARERALKAKRMEYEQLEHERNEANERLQLTQRLLKAVDAIHAVEYADALAGIVRVHREIARVEKLLAQLDVGKFAALDEEIDKLRAQEAELFGRIGDLKGREGQLSSQQESTKKTIDRLSRDKEAAQDRMQEMEQALREVHADWPEFDFEARLRFAEEEAKSFDAERCAKERERLDADLRSAERALDATLQQHNQKCRPADKVLYQAFSGSYDVALFRSIRDLRAEIDRVYNILRNNVLVAKHEELKDLKQSFNNAFVSNLCQEIYQALQDGKRQLEYLNKELENHRFGSDRERFRFAQEPIPEYREYARFFEEVVKTPAFGGEATLFEAKLSPKSEQVRDSLMKLLLDGDEQQSLRELERIADYRNYYRYEIYKEVEGKAPIPLSEYGTGSGGQLETPAYIIRSASITSALRYAEGTSHLRMVLVDEAFSKMDERRSREVIDYLTRTLGLQLIFIMPTSKCGPFLDLVSNEFVFAKVPSAPRGQLHTRVLVDRRQCNRERIAELWASHRRTVHHQAELDFMVGLTDATS